MTFRGLLGYTALLVLVVSFIAGLFAGVASYQVTDLAHSGTSLALQEGFAAFGWTFLSWGLWGLGYWAGGVVLLLIGVFLWATLFSKGKG